MPRFRPSPGIARIQPAISQDQLPPVQSPLDIPTKPGEAPEVAEQAQDLAMEIYARLAVTHISKSQDPDAQTLQALARHAQAAALAYFEAMGVQFHA